MTEVERALKNSATDGGSTTSRFPNLMLNTTALTGSLTLTASCR
ncbi:hypothetical protein QJS66_14975 [Kocuria rhizophila]|nr:hypothetical protein QJS66_14975 [Kocuria rhizophila]